MTKAMHQTKKARPDDRKGQRGGGRAMRIEKQLEVGTREDLSFLHISKTGGSAVAGFLNRMPPSERMIKFGHVWSVDDIVEKWPDMQICFMLRDPLLRNISGFNSRLRQGRPQGHWLWNPAEAAAFAFFPTAESWLRALISTDDYQLSAAYYARDAIAHLANNYVHFFGSAENAVARARNYGIIGHVDSSPEFFRDMAIRSGLPAEFADPFIKRVHVSPVETAGIVGRFSEDEQAALRAAMADEYQIYDALMGLKAKTAG